VNIKTLKLGQSLLLRAKKLPAIRVGTHDGVIKINMPGYGSAEGYISDTGSLEYWFDVYPLKLEDLPSEVAILEHIKVNEGKKNEGAGSKILQAFLAKVKSQVDAVFVNASPMHENLSFSALKNFYIKNGFKVVPKCEFSDNALMVKYFNK